MLDFHVECFSYYPILFYGDVPRNVVCSWGRGEDGQLGHGDAEDCHKPTIISDLDGCEITSIICGTNHTSTYSDIRLVVYSWCS